MLFKVEVNIDCAFDVVSKKSLPNPRSSGFSPVLSSLGVFIVLSFTCKSVISWGVEYLSGCQVVCVFACGCPVVLASFVDKQSVLSPVNCLCSCVKCS